MPWVRTMFSEAEAATIFMGLVKKYAQKVLENLADDTINDGAKYTADAIEKLPKKIVREFAQVLADRHSATAESHISSDQVHAADSVLSLGADEKVHDLRDEVQRQAVAPLGAPLDARILSAFQSPAPSAVEAWLTHFDPDSSESVKRAAENAQRAAENAERAAENAQQAAENAERAAKNQRQTENLKRVAENAERVAENAELIAESAERMAESERAAENERTTEDAERVAYYLRYRVAHEALSAFEGGTQANSLSRIVDTPIRSSTVFEPSVYPENLYNSISIVPESSLSPPGTYIPSSMSFDKPAEGTAVFDRPADG